MQPRGFRSWGLQTHSAISPPEGSAGLLGTLETCFPTLSPCLEALGWGRRREAWGCSRCWDREKPGLDHFSFQPQGTSLEPALEGHMWNPIHASCGRPSGTKVSEAESPESPETCPAGLGWEDCAAVYLCVHCVFPRPAAAQHMAPTGDSTSPPARSKLSSSAVLAAGGNPATSDPSLTRP